ncbi:hypothetical protein MMC12_003174 [Toensbergia leucococca]|nr:hypothetical protein [Toensbergia leucococca]
MAPNSNLNLGPRMPHKYSHALVLSHYEARGLLNLNRNKQPSFHDSPPSDDSSDYDLRPEAPTQSESSPTATPPSYRHSRSHSASESFQSTTTTPSRPTSSIITQIYAPLHLSSPTKQVNHSLLSKHSPKPSNPPRLQSFISPKSSPTTSSFQSSSSSSFNNNNHQQTTARTSLSAPISPISEKDSDSASYLADSSPSPPLSPTNSIALIRPWDHPHLSPLALRPNLSRTRTVTTATTTSPSPPSSSYFPTQPSTTRSASPDSALPPPISRTRRSSIPPRSKKSRFIPFLKPRKLSHDQRVTSAPDDPTPNGLWRASNYPIDNMPADEAAKLRRKGVNPRLKAEMDAATRGRGIGPLVGNTFIG